MRRAVRFILLAVLFTAAAIWVANSAWLYSDRSEHSLGLIAHRGVHQPFSRESLTNETCTAAQSLPTDHALLENTLPSIRTAFALGADVVELDIHLTTDAQLAVFHDWTLDCRTNGAGRTRDASMDQLRQLDIGYGYTFDGGQTYPFRGSGEGLLPSLDQVFNDIAGGQFLIDIKSNDASDGEALAELLQENPQWQDRVWGVYGGPVPVGIVAEQLPKTNTFHRRKSIRCLMRYILLGWSTRVPAICQDTTVYLPISHVWLMWGWPDRFVARMRDAGTRVVIIGPFERGDVGSRGLDNAEQLERVPPSLDAYIQTNHIERIAPLVGN